MLSTEAGNRVLPMAKKIDEARNNPYRLYHAKNVQIPTQAL